MGWAHEGAVTSSSVNVATMTRVGGLGESANASCVVVVPRPTAAVPEPGSEVPGPALTAAFLEPSAGALESDPTSSGGAGAKMKSDSSEGLIDDLRRR